jgi:hypothetical protein
VSAPSLQCSATRSAWRSSASCSTYHHARVCRADPARRSVHVARRCRAVARYVRRVANSALQRARSALLSKTAINHGNAADEPVTDRTARARLQRPRTLPRRNAVVAVARGCDVLHVASVRWLRGRLQIRQATFAAWQPCEGERLTPTPATAPAGLSAVPTFPPTAAALNGSRWSFWTSRTA